MATKAEFEARRTEYLLNILNSKATHKLIVAGPGTGKTFTFKELLKTENNSNNLALTFINNLVFDLASELSGLAESKTFHGFCKYILHKYPSDDIDSNFTICPYLSDIIEKDYDIFGKKLENIQDAFQNLYDDDENIDLFLKRSSYYRAVGFDDSVFRVIKQFESNIDYIPEYNLIVVDEFQDFNKLEVALINFLAIKNRMLIVGDDDQALYEKKNANPVYLRNKFLNSDYTNFELPFCSRCTKVIVDSVSEIVSNATKKGYLKNRINKKYICYLPDKELDSIKYPKIKLVNCSVNTPRAPYMAKYVERELARIPKEDIEISNQNLTPCVLIIGPRFITNTIYKYLLTSEYSVDYQKKKQQEFDVYDSIDYLLECDTSNLGWRILLDVKYVSYLKTTILNCNDDLLYNYIPQKIKDEVNEILHIIKKLKMGEEISVFEETKIIEYFEKPYEDIEKKFKPQNDIIDIDIENLKLDKPRIKITTFQGSKGLQTNYVFVVGLINGVLPLNRNNIQDKEICELIVALTRTKKQCHLLYNSFHSGKRINRSCFLDWISSDKLEYICVDKDYFSSSK